MTTRLEDVPVIKIAPTTIDATKYNRIRLGLIRLENPLRLPLPGLRGMDLIVENDAWVCVDRTLYDLPVIAWTDFETSKRTAIHEAVECQVNYFHIHANVIADSILDTAERLLYERLKPYQPDTLTDIRVLAAAKQR